MAKPEYLNNQLLIAMPAMADPNFSQTVTLICEHNARGALGIILNRPLPMRLADVFEQLSLEIQDKQLGEQTVLRGGPVQTDRGFVVHRSGGQWQSTVQVSDRIQITKSRDILAAMARGEGPPDAFIVLGFTGWDAGQLEQEIIDNAWINVPVNEQVIFELPYEDRWHSAGQLSGIDLTRISTLAGHA